jgi:hypothetical protein
MNKKPETPIWALMLTMTLLAVSIAVAGENSPPAAGAGAQPAADQGLADGPATGVQGSGAGPSGAGPSGAGPSGAGAGVSGGAEAVVAPTAADDQAVAGAAAKQAAGMPNTEEPAPIISAFGITLGERFQPCMVAEVLGEEAITYRGADKAEHGGIRYRINPRVPNVQFTDYSVDTNADGVIYAIRGEHAPQARENTCAATKELAAALTEKYGKPRGRGGFGEWYAFRDLSVDYYRGIRLYANRCRRGIYEIVYSDDHARMAEPSPSAAVEPTATSGL